MSDQSVEIGEAGQGNVELLLADVINGFVIDLSSLQLVS